MATGYGHHHNLVVSTNTGKPVSGAEVTVYPTGSVNTDGTLIGSPTASTIYSDAGVTTKANPTTSDANGNYEFYAAHGSYDVRLRYWDMYGTLTGSLGLKDVELWPDPISFAVVTKTAAYTLTASDFLCLVSAPIISFDITLPTAASAAGRIYVLKRIDASSQATTLLPTGADTIDDSGSWPITARRAVIIQSDGVSDWQVLQDTLTYVKIEGDTMEGPLNLAEYQPLNLVIENLAADPDAITKGRLYFNTGTNALKYRGPLNFLTIANTGDIATHAAAADPHTGYRLESADHTHATTGLQAGQITDSALSAAVGIAKGGSGQITQQAAIDALTAVSGATNEHVLTKDTATGNAKFKAAAGGGSGETNVASLTNKTGALANTEGYVYRMDPDNDNAFDTASEDEDAQVAVAPNGVNIAADAAGNMVHSGYEDVYVNATTTRGQYLYFSATAGQAKPSWKREDGAFAQASENRTGAGLVQAYIFPRERGRNWFARQYDSWLKAITLPLARAGGWTYYGDIASHVTEHLSGPCVLRPPDTSLWYLYYGQTVDPAGLEHLFRLQSTDGLTWTNNSDLFTVNTTGWLGTIKCGSFSVCYDPADAAYPYKAVFRGQSNVADRYAMYYIKSTDGVTWTGQTKVLDVTSNGGVGHSCSLVKLGNNKWGMAIAVSALTDIKWYESADLTTWVYRKTIVTAVAGQWDDSYLGYLTIYESSGNLYLAYTGYLTKYQIGLAYQPLADLPDTTKTFVKDLDNPIISETGSCNFPNFIQINKSFYCYYSYMVSGLYRIALRRLL